MSIPYYGYYIRSIYGMSSWFSNFDDAMSYGVCLKGMGLSYTLYCCKTGNPLE